LKNHPKIDKVNHPSLCAEDKILYDRYFPNGAGSIFTIEIKGTKDDAWKFVDKLQIFSLLANVADAKSLVIHPATTTNSQSSPEELKEQGIKPNTIRLSIGIENVNDIIADLKQALD
jgi:O-acetylhomoserine (thiol)-lyase